MKAREKPISFLPPMFPSNRRRYVRVPPDYAYKCIINILKENFELKDAEIKHLGNLSLGANLDGKIGVNLMVHITPEGDISVLNITFRYRKMVILAVSLIAAAIILSLFLSMPWLMLGVIILLPLAYQVNFKVIRFLDVLNETLPFLEQEYAHQILLKDRERWRRHQRDIGALYEKLRKKHVATWGDTKVLKYKIEEYQSMGLTYEEAIMKIAEEEDVIVD